MALMGGQIVFGTPVFGVTDASISISIDSPLSLHLDPGMFGSTSQTITVTTDNYTGHVAQLANPTNSTDLLNTNDNTLTIPTITLPQGASSVTQNQFPEGYGFSLDGTNYFPAPTSSVGLSLGQSNTAGSSNYSLHFATLPAPSTATGTYTKNFTIIAIANNPQYSVTYNTNAGADTVTGMPSNVPVTPSSAGTITLSNATPSRNDYVFLGWDTDASATTPRYPKNNTNTISLEPTQANAVTLYAIWEDGGTVQITNISYVSGINVSGTPNPSVDSDGNIDFDLTFMGGLDNTSVLQATYRLTVTNSTPSDYVFTAPASNLTLRISANEVRDISYELSGIAVGDIIPAKSAVSFNIILNADYVSGEHTAEGGIDVEPVKQTTPSLIGSIDGSNTGDLSGNHTLTSFQISVESTFEEPKSFTINSLSSDFEIVDANGNALGPQTIAAGTTNTYTFYMKKASGAAFASETSTAGITITYGDIYTNVGEVKIKVDKDSSYIDNQAPTISGVTITKNKTVAGEATLTWSGTDNVGVASYGIYRCTTSSCNSEIRVSGTTNSYTFTNMSDGTYYFVVVGYDDEGNTATQTQINNSNTSPGPASRTANTELKWTYSVTYSITNGGMSNTSGNTVRAGGTWSGTITANQGYNRPSSKDSITVTMDGTPYTNFTYNTSNYRITIENASGNITISATLQESCLIAGTLIPVLDENGQEITKPIEDITYRDLVKVWNHETGTIDYRHPARIEKTSHKNTYQLTTLSDGTTLGTVGWHGVFDVRANEFISVDDPSRFYPGLEIYKVEGDQLVVVTVESIELVEEEVNVYHILSSQYYNVVANDVLTTDGFVITSNFYGFTDENIMWPAARAEFIANPANLYTYEDFADIGIPLRMFNDLRLREASYLQRYGITLEMFKTYLVSQGVIDGMVPYDDE